jgi:hypothetical protein
LRNFIENLRRQMAQELHWRRYAAWVGEIELAASVINGFGDNRDRRDDRPELTARLSSLQLTAEGLASDLKDVKGEMSRVAAELLPDDERVRLAQFARDVRDDTLPDIDADVPLTSCPPWCEVPDHGEERVGKYHEGALTDFDAAGPGSGLTKRVVVSVMLDEEGSPLLSVGCYAEALTGPEAERLAAGIQRAAQLWNRLGGARRAPTLIPTSMMSIPRSMTSARRRSLRVLTGAKSRSTRVRGISTRVP